MSIILFFLVLFVLILVHEWGHFIVAKKTGMRVDEFGIGFPPRLFGYRWGETEYTLNALPIGGFVRIYGENAADAAADAAVGSDTTRSFTSKSRLAQALVLLAGVTMNILFAWVLFSIALALGVPSAVDEATAGSDASLMVQQVLAESPAATAELPVGATILSIADQQTTLNDPTPSAFRSFVSDRPNQSLTLIYRLGAAEPTGIVVTPKANPDVPEQGIMGVQLALVETTKLPLPQALVAGAEHTATMLKAVTLGLTGLIVDSFQGTADFSTVTGPVGIVGLVGDAAAVGMVSLLVFTAVISLNLAVINVLPFPALDGGRLLIVAIEAIRQKPINPVWVARVNLVGFVLLLALMVAVTYKDIARL